MPYGKENEYKKKLEVQVRRSKMRTKKKSPGEKTKKKTLGTLDHKEFMRKFTEQVLAMKKIIRQREHEKR